MTSQGKSRSTKGVLSASKGKKRSRGSIKEKPASRPDDNETESDEFRGQNGEEADSRCATSHPQVPGAVAENPKTIEGFSDSDASNDEGDEGFWEGSDDSHSEEATSEGEAMPTGKPDSEEESSSEEEVSAHLSGAPLQMPMVDLKTVKQRMEYVLARLSKGKRAKTQGAPSQDKKSDTIASGLGAETNHKSRRELMEMLKDDVVQYYQYSPELAEYFLQLFSPNEAIAFFEANEQRRPLTIRTNTLKTRRRDLAASLISRGCNVDPLGEWSRVGLKVYDSSVPVGATPEYLAGYYMLQSASSLVPVMALAPQPGERVVDMSAAPGGKTSHICQLMNNEGVVFANDLKKERCTSLMANLQRMGCSNAIVCCLDGRRLPTMLPMVDRVLLDAPCTGAGIIARDSTIKVKRSQTDFLEHSKLQKQLLCAAVDLVDANSSTGGYIVYSTCSVSVEENEEVIDYILKARHVKLVPLGVDVGSPALTSFRGRSFHPSLALHARRILPHLNNMDGFFVCKLRKLSNQSPSRAKKDRSKTNPYVKVWGPEKWNEGLGDKFLEFDSVEDAAPSSSNGNRDGNKKEVCRNAMESRGKNKQPRSHKQRRVREHNNAKPESISERNGLDARVDGAQSPLEGKRRSSGAPSQKAKKQRNVVCNPA